ncbi:indolethylamine N-methyltransferase-like [Hyperolius riggenbachi]|uniref:indolethylamine N-methyltransferase-like n=1 Tax=Hyperolius riggenbachi TaxID=752182 RepID=UPI0035A2BFC8
MSEFTGPDDYHKHFDPKAYLAIYYPVDGDTLPKHLPFVLERLAKIFGKVKGDTMIDIGTGPTIYQLLSACEAFKNVIVSDFTDKNREEFKTWLTNQPGAHDWSPVVKYVCQLEGNRISWKEKEDNLRKAIKRILKCDVLLSNPLDPVVLPQADCILSCLALESACKDQQAYVTALNNVTSLLKPGGHLVLTGALESHYYMVGEVKFSGLFLTEKFIRESLSGIGYVVESFETSEKEFREDVTKYAGVFVMVARRNA